MIIYDTTLRDGTQSPDINLSVHDKLEICRALDEFGVDYIELGWPGSNPKDMQCFKEAAKLKFNDTKISAFASTKRKGLKAEDDPNLKAVITSGADACSIFGKTWVEHVQRQLGITKQENVDAITESISFLEGKGIEVFFDAEHFFDGYKDDAEYALQVLEAARDSGASCLVLCDTNGGMLPGDVQEIVRKVKSRIRHTEIGIHCHNDSGMAAANSMMAVISGATHIQGTINGFGERTGNCDLTTAIPNMMLKMGIDLPKINLEMLSKISDLVYTLTNEKPEANQPFVGRNAFSHKGGIHVDAIMKGASYEHIDPGRVGNKRGIILSDLSGKANIVEVAKKFGIRADKNDPRVRDMLDEVEDMEKRGYDIKDLDAEKFLLVNKHLGNKEKILKIDSWQITSKDVNQSECSVTGEVEGKRRQEKAVAKGGPVEAAYSALKRMLLSDYPQVKDLKLVNYKVMIAKDMGAESSVRVYIEFENRSEVWGCVGVNINILEASIEAIQKGFMYYILKHEDVS
ncbi:citramalate synthase [Candidatus Woesearchaeota archaeon]|nr:citramalate synthase [Candidatus Woesearchaeota archaeon]